MLVIATVTSIYIFTQNAGVKTYDKMTEATSSVFNNRLNDLTTNTSPDGVLVGNIATFIAEYETNLYAVEVTYDGASTTYSYDDFSIMFDDLARFDSYYGVTTMTTLNELNTLHVAIRKE